MFETEFDLIARPGWNAIKPWRHPSPRISLPRLCPTCSLHFEDVGSRLHATTRR